MAGNKNNSLAPGETEKFEALADQWWDETGKFAPLHRLNPARLEAITTQMRQHFRRDSPTPFSGLRILDIGCGGGLVCEPMARLGGNVLGVDSGAKNIGAARAHAERAGLDIEYRSGTVESLLAANEPVFDVILNLEVIEHVANPEQFLADCASLLAPGGLMAIASINRTAAAFLLAIVGAEYILQMLPRGTHEFSRFVRPDEITNILQQAGLSTMTTIGMSYNPLSTTWSQSNNISVNYILFATGSA